MSIHLVSIKVWTCRCQPRPSFVTSSVQLPESHLDANFLLLIDASPVSCVPTANPVRIPVFRLVNVRCFGCVRVAVQIASSSARRLVLRGPQVGHHRLSHLFHTVRQKPQLLHVRYVSWVSHVPKGFARSPRPIDCNFATIDSRNTSVFSIPVRSRCLPGWTPETSTPGDCGSVRLVTLSQVKGGFSGILLNLNVTAAHMCTVFTQVWLSEADGRSDRRTLVLRSHSSFRFRGCNTPFGCWF